MEAQFWQQKWQTGDIGFHEAQVNSLLVKHIHRLELANNNRIFIPLCGKTNDIGWLLAQGYQVAGAELSDIAIKELFNQLGVEPQITSTGQLQHYQAAGIDIFVGDIFNLDASQLGRIDAIYDRAALVALPAKLRQQYSRHLMNITQQAKQLLICYEYDQQTMSGPPFSVSAEEVHQHYLHHYHLEHVDQREVTGRLASKVQASESVWILR